MSVNVVILAAGQGKRMYSQLPKVLHTLAGRPMIEHVLAAADVLSPRQVCVVYGHGGERVREALARPELAFARQEPQLGTGHAVQQALPVLSDAETTVVLCGDVPLIKGETLQRLVSAAGNGVAVLTAVLDDAYGYGRIIRGT